MRGKKMINESLKISPCYTVKDWKVLDLSTEEAWQKAIDIFENRIRGRFLEPISYIEGYTYAGFAVLALDCLLIEALQQFREGIGITPYRQSKTLFRRFLTETSFGSYFSKETAEMFYDQIRCGILHQAEVKKSSRVRIGEEVPLVSTTDDDKGLVINRKLFHKQLLSEFGEYLSNLRDPSNIGLRAKFRKKMDYICRVTIFD